MSDPRWYESGARGDWVNEAWRDPWVLADPQGEGWHMLLTARAPHGARCDRGVIGHAWSPDLRSWEVRPPLSRPGVGFGQLEVPQVAVVDGQAVLIFSCLVSDMSAAWQASGTTGGVWALPCDSLTGPFDVSLARLLIDDTYYSGRLVQDRRGRWILLAFRNRGDDDDFGGYLSDPVPVHWSTPGTLTVQESPE